ncbi:type I DNA topoisomerase [Candidatus Parabeggiatoa sp. HSG14]|uniref:type I DNA topoisomerase n=1 Tax=Candidatus Parabeggiatoa sp. HSG14 TaxID=3055593 RepID=UPI0025A8D95D|nr:type I DNA topoisomerase [Thiotrichales bacterium HSG14]
MSKLVIVESPAKAKTIKKYLGKDFEVLASFGHVRDLKPKEGAVDTDNNFAMRYQLIARNAKHLNAISQAMEHADELFLATDPDREGEAISWHLCEILKDKKMLLNKSVHRVEFHEITQRAIKEAVSNPRDLSMDLINAQQARRALDYLVGFNLSPLLWKKIRYGLSAGRVQSPALRLIVERELDIEKFESREYWTIEANCKKSRHAFTAKLNLFEGNKLTQFSISDKEQANTTVLNLATQGQLQVEKEQVNEEQVDEEQAKHIKFTVAKGQLQVAKVEKKQRKRQPSAPFTTSTIQQEAARKLGFTAKRTMQVAQQLYEGIDIGNGSVGLITYMRTDSVTLAKEAVEEIREVISELYGKDNVPKQPREYKTKAKNAQEAHEAIRPTSAKYYPDDIKKHLKPEQLKLYTLIWKRTIACQMIHATLDTVAVDLACGEGNNFRANGSTLVIPGFMAVYQEGIDDKEKTANEAGENEKMLPPLKVGEMVNLNNIHTDQHFTDPPPRFTEASLVKSLEEFGIGRPSTYAAIISTLQQRDYVKLEKKRFTPTDVGRVVNKFLTEHFFQYVDYDFTAKLEDQLDAVSRGEQEWIPLMDRFWSKFKKLVDEKALVKREEVTQEVLDESCPKCKQHLTKRLGRGGQFFIGCSAYPDCDYTRRANSDGSDIDSDAPPEVVEGRTCPECESELHIKQGPYSKFIGCSKYPKCKFNESLDKSIDTGVTCPKCDKGTLNKKKSRFGFFYSCSTYPTCKYAISDEPIKEACPKCGWPILMQRVTKTRGTKKICPQKKECGHIEKIPTEPAKS